MSCDVAVLLRWHDAVNTGNIEAAVRECTPDVAVRGPRGVGHGHQLVRDWLTRSGIRLTPLEEMVERDGRYVVRERARWTTVEADPVETYCVFVLTGGKVSSIARYDDQAEIPSPDRDALTTSA